MPCYRPLLAHRAIVAGENGKRPLTFKSREAYTDLPVMVPCGKCIGCKTDKTNEWAARCYHESKMHKENCFLTLTYNNENLPPGGTLVKEHLQSFMKSLRQEIYPNLIRFYGAGEYGDKLSRPHYHILVFGHSFPDRKLHALNRKQDQQLFISDTLGRLWKKGFHLIGHLDLASAKYVAAYTAKKITGEKAESHYNGKLPEFALMSRRPGIGHDWFKKYTSDVYPKDYFHIKGVRYRPPLYYDKLLEKDRPKTMKKVRERREKASKENDVGGVRRYYVADVKTALKKQQERRRLENEQSESVLRPRHKIKRIQPTPFPH